ncbi:MAG: hypothetical protein M3403_04485 [Gemmatimonadota bacterium]|nr:hypothetical protein [Gemmatimonadota bacterium]
MRFETEAGQEVPAVTAQEMRELDRIAVEETGPNLWQMMENAGRSLAEFLICQEGADWRAARAPGLRVALRVSLVDRG